MDRTLSIIRGTLIVVLFLGALGWVMWRCLRRSEEPERLIIKWIVTALLLPVIWKAGQTGTAAPIFGAVIGLILAITWRHSITAMVARPFVNLFTGGETPPDPAPFYSIAEAKRRKGLYHQAVFEIHKQLQQFPNDVTGQLLLAEIQAENLNDLPGAQVTIDRMLAQPGHVPGNIATALNSLADWHMKFAQDIPAAQQALEQIITLLPNTTQAQMAANRIAHLGTTEGLLASRDRQALRVRAGVENIGLLKQAPKIPSPEADPATKAAEYVKHLEAHPLDSEVREKLAMIYAEHYHRLDLATDQLEQLIQQPNQPAAHQARWLNLLANLHLEHGHDYEMAKGALQRVIDFHAGTALAAMAEQRLARLRLDLKGKEQGHVIKLGTYQQDIGLNKGTPEQGSGGAVRGSGPHVL
jgi:tetratricopeptide (TPR) repeat protein